MRKNTSCADSREEQCSGTAGRSSAAEQQGGAVQRNSREEQCSGTAGRSRAQPTSVLIKRCQRVQIEFGRSDIHRNLRAECGAEGAAVRRSTAHRTRTQQHSSTAD